MFPQRYGVSKAASTLTRAQVIRETEEARRSGDLLVGGESGLRLNEANPAAYPARVAVAGKTRTQVNAELQEAIRTGNIVANGESGLLMRDVFPQQYANVRPAQDAAMAATPSGLRAN